MGGNNIKAASASRSWYNQSVPSVLSDPEVNRFVADGYLRLDNAFDGKLAAACVAELWSSLDADPHDSSTWTAPVVRIAGSGSSVLLEAINAPRLVSAIDDVVGIGQWRARTCGYGTFPVRFPSHTDPGDTGWHIDRVTDPNQTIGDVTAQPRLLRTIQQVHANRQRDQLQLWAASSRVASGSRAAVSSSSSPGSRRS